jgi:hypothetical protein
MSLLLARVLIAFLSLVPVYAQQFDVASVKPTVPINLVGGAVVFGFGPMMGGPGTADPTHITWTNVPLQSVVLQAYDVRRYQVVTPGGWQRSATTLQYPFPRERQKPRSA